MTIVEINKKIDIILSKVSSVANLATERNILLSEAETLAQDIENISKSNISLDDYKMLNDLALKLESVFSTYLEKPTMIKLSKPKIEWLPTSNVFTEEEIENWLRYQASFIAYAKRSEKEYPDKDKDWALAEIFFASEIIEGKINFVNRIAPESYWRLENIWVNEVKRMLAYFRWIEVGKPLFVQQDKDFFEICDHIRNDLLKNKNMKSSISRFEPIKEYINNYLTGGKIVASNEKANKLIGIKANNLFKISNEKNTVTNWLSAESYVKGFYENVINAVETKNKKSIFNILNTFYLNRKQKLSFMNCFELAIAIYFFDAEIVDEVFKEIDVT